MSDEPYRRPDDLELRSDREHASRVALSIICGEPVDHLDLLNLARIHLELTATPVPPPTLRDRLEQRVWARMGERDQGALAYHRAHSSVMVQALCDAFGEMLGHLEGEGLRDLQLVRDVRDLCADVASDNSNAEDEVRELDPADLLARVHEHRRIRRARGV